MREVIAYVAYDGEEFENREDCEKYEEKAFNYLNEIFNSYRFFLEDEQEYFIVLNGIEKGLKDFEHAWDISKYIQVSCLLSEETYDFIIDYFGYDMPENEIGLYKYELYRGWVKVDE